MVTYQYSYQERINTTMNMINDNFIKQWEKRDLDALNQSELVRLQAGIDITDMAQLCRKFGNALEVFTKDERISAWLRDNDPKALEQGLEALGD